MDVKELFDSFFASSSIGAYLSLNDQTEYFSLNDDEQQLASIVFPIVLHEVRQQRSEAEPSDAGAFDMNAGEARNKLSRILYLFNQAAKARSDFLRNFPEWREIRKRNVKDLRDIASSVHRDRLNTNISRLIGSSVGITGGVALFGCLLFPPAAPLLLPLSIGSGIVAALGGTTVLGTTIAEIIRLKKKVKKAVKILHKDKETLKTILKWFEHTIALVETFEVLLGFEVMTTLVEEKIKSMDDIRSSNSKLAAVIRNCIKRMLESGHDLEKRFGINLTSFILTFCFVIVLLHKQNSFIFYCVSLTHGLVIDLLNGRALNLGRRNRLYSISYYTSVVGVSANIAARSVIYTILAGVGIALDAATIVLTSMDMRKGSVSEHGKDITIAAEKLNEELDFLEIIYNELNRGD